MTPDLFQEAWQSQPLPAVDVEPFVREFRRGEQRFGAMIFWRDFRETVVGLAMLPAWVVMGVGMGLPWSWYLAMPGIAWVVAFIALDRKRQGRRRALPGDPLIRGVGSSLGEVDHQIWLLRNVHWWYLLPLAVPMVAFFADISWRASRGVVWEATVMTSSFTGVVAIAYTWVYRINQKAIRTTLEPRRRELGALLRSLSDEPPLPRSS